MTDLPRLALSIRQPWAHCVLHLGKPVENRSWPTNVRGTICIHASKSLTLDDYVSAQLVSRDAGFFQLPERKSFQRGGIVGVVDIVDCVTDHPSPWFFGPYGFVLENPRVVPFVEVSGALGFFEWRNRLKD